MPITQQIGSSSLSKPGVCTSTTRPSSPYDGMVIYETDTDKTLVWNGSSWVFLSTSSANPVGLEYITTTIWANAASAYNTANVFSSNYTNYRIVIDKANSSSGYENLRFRLSSAGVTSQSSYYHGTTYVVWGGGTGTNGINGGTYSLAVNVSTSETPSNCVIDIYRPFIADETSWTAIGQGSDASWAGNGIHDIEASYDGITFYVAVGNLSGTARFYGYKQV